MTLSPEEAIVRIASLHFPVLRAGVMRCAGCNRVWEDNVGCQTMRIVAQVPLAGGRLE